LDGIPPWAGNQAPDPAPPEAPTPWADDTPPGVRQTLDELAILVTGQRQIAAEAGQNRASVPPSAASFQDVRLQFQRMTGQAPSPAADSREEATSPDRNGNAAPAVTRHTYQTNLPPAQRRASPLQSRPDYRRQSISGGMSVEVAARQSPVAVPENGPANPPPSPAPPENPPLPAPPADILSGISPRFLPSRLLAQARVEVAAPPNIAGLPIQAGGPSLRGPEEIALPAALGNPAPPRGSLLAPVRGEISSPFGWRLDPLTGQRAWHAGVDIKARPGESVLAARDGTVSFIGRHPELGNLVIVDHGDDLRTFYGHNQTLRVSVDQKVSAGMEIAQAGASGRAAGPHVHFEVRRGELAVNPEPLLRQRESLTAAVR
jgi:murein DD-endopeptidase MepM/ murein hydrolase activator NlpD